MEEKIVEIKSIQEFLNLAKEEKMSPEEQALREYIRKKILKNLKEQEEKEYQLRTVVRRLLREGDISDIHPHRSTAINTLEDVLKKAIPTLRKDYKNLTTDEAQRQSFRSHILKAIKDALAPAINNAKYGSGGALLSEPAPDDVKGAEPAMDDEGDDLDAELAALEEELGDVDIDISGDEDPMQKDDKDKKLNVEPDEKPDEKQDFGSGLEDMDETGRNMAYTSFRKISQYILDAFDMLANPKDKEVFMDYLLTNLKLYFDKFETELQKTVDEPDSPEPQ
ncbi:MAG: hypothetical protein ACW97P_08465 [Candidatus Hodarchaeales archaeon]